MRVRPTERNDVDAIRFIIRATEMFSEEEIEIASELLDIYVNDPHQRDYEMYTCVADDESVAGYICIGPTPATVATYDLYWIAVDPTKQNSGAGTRLVQFVADKLKSTNGRLLIAETSSTPKYDKTRAFYERKGFQKLAHIKEYYKPDDDLIIYGLYL
ncbi:MAG: GNAT family N-acetyltransferase [Bacteroidota bacterium]